MRGRGLALMAGASMGRRRGAEQAQYEMAMQQQQAPAAQPQAQPAAPAPAAPAPAPTTNITAELQKLAQLHQSGVLSDEEFAAAKQKLLSGQ